jgi:O-antigen/teichoic acid export membrane protein
MLAMLGLTAYASGLTVFYAMLPGIFLRMMSDVPSYAVYAAHSDKSLLACNLGSALVSTVLNLVLVPRLGILGAALASGVASATLFASLAVFALRKLRENGREHGAPPSAGLPTDPDMLYP